ncbi:DoxX-like family protein [Ureibacillus sp. NPDC094379]
MKSKPIYVEIEIQSPVDEVWEYTQKPKLHEKWDLRFTSITYKPKNSEEDPQRFTYITKVIPGISVEGWGESKGTHHKNNGTRTSSLQFGTDQRISPIAEGKGYWQYNPHQNGVTFLTQYDYDVRFGMFGRLFDLLFRPLMGWATALSFDVLKRWIEKGELPAAQYSRFLVNMLTSLLFFFVWFYHGLVPKAIFKHEDELTFFTDLLGMSNSLAQNAVFMTGIAEMAFAFVWLLPIRKRVLFGLQIWIFPILTLCAVLADVEIMVAAFNPVTFNAALWVLSIIGFMNSKNLPTAKTCKRKRGPVS